MAVHDGPEYAPTCWPRTIGPLQREHTIGGKPLGASGCLRRAPVRAGFFGVGCDIAIASIDERTNRGVVEGIVDTARDDRRPHVDSPKPKIRNADAGTLFARRAC